MSEYLPTIGLEVHAELKTRTKMFCDSANDPDETRPNVNICPICTAQPGTLPTINKAAVRHVLRVGVACGSKIADYSEFDRKNYFYPDIPKGYQISQYKYPLVSGGALAGVDLTRIHLEEDTASNIHESDHSLIDFNRAGIPLMELVTEPVMHDSKAAGNFARELQLLLRYLEASEANMEKGEMRLEANVSVAPRPALGVESKGGPLGTKVEVKNIASFRALERAIEYEIKRQTDALESGEKIVQETRGWDDVKQKTVSQRKKESSHDYRYFPEPDLPKMMLNEIPDFAPEALRRAMPELPWQKRERYVRDYDLKAGEIEVYISDVAKGVYFESVASSLVDTAKIKIASNLITNELTQELPKEKLVKIVNMFAERELSSRGVKDIIAALYDKEEGDPERLADELGLRQKHDEGELGGIVEQVISENPTVVDQFKAGKDASLQYLVGQGMKLSHGSANPGVLSKLLREQLSTE